MSLKAWLVPILTSGGVLYGRTVAQQAEVIKAYLHAVAKLWPDAWGNVKDYNLCRPTGFEIMFAVFGTAKTRCDPNCGKQYTIDSFLDQMRPVQNVVIDMFGIGEVALEWQRGKMTMLANKTTRELIAKQLRNHLVAADA